MLYLVVPGVSTEFGETADHQVTGPVPEDGADVCCMQPMMTKAVASATRMQAEPVGFLTMTSCDLRRFVDQAMRSGGGLVHTRGHL